jgi:hypothetical protein
MKTMDYHAVLTALRSSDGDEQVAAVSSAADIVATLAREAVDALRRGPYRLLIAERLAAFGSAAVAPLMELCTTTEDEEVKVHASLVLLQFHSPMPIPWLLDVIQNGDHADQICMVANGLARAHIADADSPIIARLRTISNRGIRGAEYDLTKCLLSALEILGAELPEDLRRHLSTPDTPWEIRVLLDPDEMERARQRLQQGEPWDAVVSP